MVDPDLASHLLSAAKASGLQGPEPFGTVGGGDPGPRQVSGAPVSLVENVAVVIGFTLLAAVYLRMTPARFLGALVPDKGDPLFNLSLLRWGADRALHGFAGFWSPTFFYPVPGVLALSDHLAGPAVASALLSAIGLPPAGVYNFLLLVAFAGSAWTCYLVLRWSGLGAWGALLAAHTWSFTCFRWSALSHLQVLLALWIPLTLWALDRLLAEPSLRRSALFLLAYGAQVSGGSYLAYMIHLPLAVILVTRLRWGTRKLLSWRAAAQLAAAVGGALALVWIFFVPYLSSQGPTNVAPTVRELRGNLVAVASYFSVGARTLYAEWVPRELRTQPALWLGWVPASMAALGVAIRIAAWRGRRRNSGRGGWWGLAALVVVIFLAFAYSDWVLSGSDLATSAERRSAFRAFRVTSALLLLAVGAFVLIRHRSFSTRPRDDREIWWRGLLNGGLACVVFSHAAPFLLLRTAVPGLAAIRVPGRIFVFTSLALAALAGLGLDALRTRLRSATPRAGLAVPVLALLLAGIETTPRGRYLQWTDIPSPAAIPAVYRWVADHDEVRALLELPMLDSWREAERLYFWSIHRRPLVNGYSAYLPRPYLDLRASLLDFPDANTSRRLGDLGVTHVVIHLGQLSRSDQRAFRRWQTALDGAPSPWMEKVYEEDSEVIYRLVSRDG